MQCNGGRPDSDKAGVNDSLDVVKKLTERSPRRAFRMHDQINAIVPQALFFGA